MKGVRVFLKVAECGRMNLSGQERSHSGMERGEKTRMWRRRVHAFTQIGLSGKCRRQ